LRGFQGSVGEELAPLGRVGFPKETPVQTTFICPQTSAALSFDLPADEAALPALWSKPLKINCPVCQTIHILDYKNAYITGVMSEFQCIPADVKQARVH
jgi:hypothetical protein